MTDINEFRKSFDDLTSSLMWDIPKKRQIDAQQEIFDFKRKFPQLFEVNEDEFQKELEKLNKQIKDNTTGQEVNKIEKVFKILRDSFVSDGATTTTITPNITSKQELVNQIKRAKQNVKISSRESFCSLLCVASLLDTCRKKFPRQFPRVLKEVGYSKSYGYFMLRIFTLANTYPEFNRVSAPISFIRTNITLIEEHIMHYFTANNPSNDVSITSTPMDILT